MNGRYSIIKRVLKIVFFPIIWLFTSSEREERWIASFSKWFGGVPAFKQQTLVIILWTISILTGIIHDPGMFHFMVALTIYSAITQPMIAIGTAIANRLATAQALRSEEQTRQLVKQNAKLEALVTSSVHTQQALVDMIDILVGAVTRTEALTDNISDDVDIILEQSRKKQEAINAGRAAVKSRTVRDGVTDV